MVAAATIYQELAAAKEHVFNDESILPSSRNKEIIRILQKKHVFEIKNVKNGEEQEIACDGVFVSVGRVPATRMIETQIALDEKGYIIADESTKTNLPGVFAVGDIRKKVLRQIVTATADGANAAYATEEYLANWAKNN